MSITEIITLVLKIMAFVLTVIVIPIIKQKYDQAQIDRVSEKIMTCVQAAEQIFASDKGPEKKQWVRERLLGWGIDVDLDIIDAEIESCVLLCHAALRD